MTVALAIAVGVLLVAGLVYLARWWGGMARHARLAIPCDEVIELPAGVIAIHYEDARPRQTSERPEPWPGFSVLVSEAESERRMDLGPAPDSPGLRLWRRVRVPYATLEIPSPGRYRVTAEVNNDAIEPHVTLS